MGVGPVGGPMDEGTDELLRLLKIGPEDIAANRDGHTGPGQRRDLRRQAAGWLVVGVAIGGLLGTGVVVGLARDVGKVGNWLAPLLFGIPITGWFLWSAAQTWRESRSSRPVTRYTGPVQVNISTRSNDGRGPITSMVILEVGSTSLAMPFRFHGRVQRFQALLADGEFVVYANGKRVVGIEPLVTTGRISP